MTLLLRCAGINRRRTSRSNNITSRNLRLRYLRRPRLLSARLLGWLGWLTRLGWLDRLGLLGCLRRSRRWLAIHKRIDRHICGRHACGIRIRSGIRIRIWIRFDVFLIRIAQLNDFLSDKDPPDIRRGWRKRILEIHILVHPTLLLRPFCRF